MAAEPLTKDQAEALKFAAEARRADAEALMHSTTNRKLVAEAEVAEVTARMRRIDLMHSEENHQIEQAADGYHGIYRFAEAVDERSTTMAMNSLTTWDRLWPEKAFEIVFTSPGGTVIYGLALFDHIRELRRKGHHITTSTLGIAASMASVLLQAGDKRVMAKESYLLIHEGSFGVHGSVGQVEDQVKWFDRIRDRILDIYADRSALTKAEIKRRWTRKDWFLDSDEALKFGFVDEVR
jgi:ATP-dependent Clp endopeptidase proteolytic subunit ClpP